MFLHELEWQRMQQPVFSALTTRQDWCRVQLYDPTVVRVGGLYKMWYLGNYTATRTNDMDLGFAESGEGVYWTAYPDNPILSAEDLPWGKAWQTPHVMFDADEQIYKMWFVMADSERDESFQMARFGQKLGYATSKDGLRWQIHPEPIYESGRRPCVIKDGSNAYRMWMNSQPDPEWDEYRTLTRNIYRFESEDGIHWRRDVEPMLTSGGHIRSVVYPFVMVVDGDYTMWYGCHVEGGRFEIFCSISEDGIDWIHFHDQPAFGATRDPNDFDGRYTSTPCVLDDGDRYLMYYSARDWGNLYGAGDGTVKVDKDGIYRHISVAVCPKG